MQNKYYILTIYLGLSEKSRKVKSTAAASPLLRGVGLALLLLHLRS